MNKEIITKRFKKASDTYSQEAIVQKQIAHKLFELLLPFKRNSQHKILEIGCGTGFLSQLLTRNFISCDFTLNDICADMEKYIITNGSTPIKFVAGDAETTDFQRPFDIVASSSAIQWFTDLPAFFRKTRDMLTSEGIIAFSSFGSDNFKEIRSITGNGLSYESLKDSAESHFHILQYREEHITLHFESGLAVLKHLRKTGVNGTQNDAWTRSRLTEFITKYNELFHDNEGVTLTYHPVYLIAKKRQS